MVNLFSAVKDSNTFPKMSVNELLFVEYTCMQEENKFGIWSHSNYFAFITSGKKVWKTTHHSYEVYEGDIIFVKKGANITHQFFSDEFCAIFMFIPDDFVKSFLKKNNSFLNTPAKDISRQDAVLRVAPDRLLQVYLQSIRSYLYAPQTVNRELVLLKFEELLLNLVSNKKHVALADFFISLCQSQQYQMNMVMEQNFSYNLTLENYAQLCHMSLSTFKKCFRQYYQTSPGAWLKNRKLSLAVEYLINTDLSVMQTAFECGFEDTSHFIKVFKEKHQLTPLQYRQRFSKLSLAAV